MEANSSKDLASIGVPQGLILGPFLFFACNNGLPLMVGNYPKMIIFAHSLIFTVNRIDKIKYLYYILA